MIAHLISHIKSDFTDKKLFPVIEINTYCIICPIEFKIIIYHGYGCLHLTEESIEFSDCVSNLRSSIYVRDNILHFIASEYMYPQLQYSYVYLINEGEFMSGYDYTCRKLQYK